MVYVQSDGSNCEKPGLLYARDNFESYRFSDRKGKLVTYSIDYVTPDTDPPMVLAMVNADGGKRLFVLMTDKEESKVEIGIRMYQVRQAVGDERG